jgi:hypothetical protein
MWSTYLERDRAPANSRPASVYSSSSTHHLLPPVPFNFVPPSTARDSSSNLSLTVNYLPSKFSATLLDPGGTRRRKKGEPDLYLPKRGGGVDAFKSGANRIPGREDEDEWQQQKKNKRMKWTKFKWILFVANIFLSLYSLTSLVFCLLTWFNIFTHSDILRVANRPELITSTIAAAIGILTSIIGWAGILLNNRGFLAVYAFMCWITFAWLLVPGYITYRRRTFNLEGKINNQWSRELGPDGRLRIQNQLQCCGYFSPFVEATISATCYARSILPGCKADYLHFERFVLGRWFTVAFAIVPVHLFVMISALLCSNHVTYRFGKGLMPPAYRLTAADVKVIREAYADQLAQQYGPEVAKDILERSSRQYKPYPM